MPGDFLCSSVVWTSGTFEDNFEINHKLDKYLKESYLLVSDKHLAGKRFVGREGLNLKDALNLFADQDFWPWGSRLTLLMSS